MSASKACARCGGRVEETDKFCFGCGAKIEGQVQPEGRLRTFLLFSVVSGILFAVLYGTAMHAVNGMPLSGAVASGILFGLLFGGAMTWVMKTETYRAPVTDRQDFLYRTNTMLAKIGYVQESGSDAFFTYKPTFRAGLLAGKITITLGRDEAAIVGPAMHLKRLKWGI